MALSYKAFVIWAVFIVSACTPGADTPAPSPSRNKDPARCVLKDLGDAGDAINAPIPDDQLVAVQGISNPKILVWRDEAASQIFYVTRISGTGGQLLYMAEIKLGETPAALSYFEGTIRLWESLPADLSRPMAAAIRSQWDIVVDPSRTWLIKGGSRPEGCP